MNDVLKQRLAGALVLIAAAFILSLLLPAPGQIQGGGDERRVTIDLSAVPEAPQATTPAPVTPVPPVIAAPEKTVHASETIADIGEAAPKIEAPPASADSLAMAERNEQPAAVPIKPDRAALAATGLAKPALKSEAPAKAAVPLKPAQKIKPESVVAAAAEKPEAPVPPIPAPALKLESSLQHAPVASPKPPSLPDAKAVVTQPAPGAKPAQPEAVRQWYVQAGAFTDVANARQALTRLGAGGFKGIISPADTSSGTRYRVRIGPYATRDQARTAQQRMAPLGFSGGALAED